MGTTIYTLFIVLTMNTSAITTEKMDFATQQECLAAESKIKSHTLSRHATLKTVCITKSGYSSDKRLSLKLDRKINSL
jgi:hypothetical protein